VRGLAEIAQERGQRMSQLAIAWLCAAPLLLRIAGASSVEQLDENLDALNNLDFTDEELKRIDQFALESASTSGVGRHRIAIILLEQ